MAISPRTKIYLDIRAFDSFFAAYGYESFGAVVVEFTNDTKEYQEWSDNLIRKLIADASRLAKNLGESSASYDACNALSLHKSLMDEIADWDVK